MSDLTWARIQAVLWPVLSIGVPLAVAVLIALGGPRESDDNTSVPCREGEAPGVCLGGRP